MSYTNQLRIILVMIILTAITIGGVYASTVSVSGGQISQAGDTISVPITLDVAENGLIYYQMTITVGDPTVTQVTKVDFPSWVGIPNVATTLPATTVYTTAGDLPPQGTPFHIQAGALNVPIATVTLQGLKPGSTPITVQFVYQDLAGTNVHPTVHSGTLQVGGTVPTPTVTVTTTTTTATSPTPTVTATTTVRGTVPTPTVTATTTTTATSPTPTVTATTTTTVVPTTTTVVPTTAPYTGPTGQVYISTTPQGAQIILDGTPTGAVTPIIMTIPVGNHGVVLKLVGYDELEANFEIKRNARATVSRRLTPGRGVIPITLMTTVVTTVPTTTVTQITTVPTPVPTIVPTTAPGAWSFEMIFPSWFTKILPFNWG